MALAKCLILRLAHTTAIEVTTLLHLNINIKFRYAISIVLQILSYRIKVAIPIFTKFIMNEPR